MRNYWLRKILNSILHQRTCNPEIYGIRELLYGHIRRLASHPPKGPSRNNDHLERDIETSTKLIQLFDDVLQEEYSQGHDSLPLIPQTSQPQTCDFCGANMFLSAFQCTGKCKVDKVSHPRNATPVVCPACFVEGRTCFCGNMSPSRLQSFSTALEQRNSAAAAVRRLQGSKVENPLIGPDRLRKK